MSDFGKHEGFDGDILGEQQASESNADGYREWNEADFDWAPDWSFIDDMADANMIGDTHILGSAARVVYGERRSTYGTPEDSFQTIGALWGVYLGRVITSEQVAAMMILLKVARLKEQGYHRDSVVDIAGYAECLARTAESKGEK